MIEKIRDILIESGSNVFDIAIYYDGKCEYATVNRACKCQNSYSVAKSIISLAVGIAQSEGYLSIDDLIVKYLISDLPVNYDDKLNTVKIKHLLTMSMGHDEGYLFESDRYSNNENNWLKLCLSNSLKYNAGEKFVYSNSCYYLLSCVLHRAVGEDALSYIREKIFSPLGINNYAWERCPIGEIIGATGLYISTEDLLKIGILCLNKGKAPGGGVIVDADYLREATTIQAPNAKYGYGFWITDDCYKAVGSHSQTINIFYDQGIVFSSHAFDENIKYDDILRSVINHNHRLNRWFAQPLEGATSGLTPKRGAEV